jgi:hypothetical protein
MSTNETFIIFLEIPCTPLKGTEKILNSRFRKIIL